MDHLQRLINEGVDAEIDDLDDNREITFPAPPAKFKELLKRNIDKIIAEKRHYVLNKIEATERKILIDVTRAHSTVRKIFYFAINDQGTLIAEVNKQGKYIPQPDFANLKEVGGVMMKIIRENLI